MGSVPTRPPSRVILRGGLTVAAAEASEDELVHDRVQLDNHLMNAEPFHGRADWPNIIDKAEDGTPLPCGLGWICDACGTLYAQRNPAELYYLEPHAVVEPKPVLMDHFVGPLADRSTNSRASTPSPSSSSPLASIAAVPVSIRGRHLTSLSQSRREGSEASKKLRFSAKSGNLRTIGHVVQFMRIASFAVRPALGSISHRALTQEREAAVMIEIALVA
jgi:hypothetical protein